MTDTYDAQLGKRLQSIRETKGLMQSEVAAMMQAAGVNWSQTIYSKVERGDRPLRVEEAEKLVNALQLESIDDLTGPRSPFAGRMAALSLLLSERRWDALHAAQAYLQTFGQQAMAQMLQDLKADRLAMWELNDVRFDITRLLPASAGFDPGRMDLVFEMLELPDSVTVSAKKNAAKLLSTWDADPADPDGWGEYSEHFPVMYESDDPDSSRWMAMAHAETVAYGQTFFDYFPNVRIREGMLYASGTFEGYMQEVLQKFGGISMVYVPKAQACSVGGDMS